jgi:hypothetical protein
MTATAAPGRPVTLEEFDTQLKANFIGMSGFGYG